MAESEKIEGAAIPKLFEELLHYKTPLKLTVFDTDEQHLTLISALVNRNKVPHLAIDIPEGIEHTIAKIDPGIFTLNLQERIISYILLKPLVEK